MKLMSMDIREYALHLLKFEDKRAYSIFRREWVHMSYREVIAKSLSISRDLEKLQLKGDDKIAIILDSCPEYICAWLASVLSGHATLLLDSKLSFYRTSEISGALFFGRLARSLPAGPIQNDLTQHFADEPTNIMEILGITLIFEKRVIGQYAIHHQVPDLNPVIKSILDRIMNDEKWHVQWVTDALKSLEKEYGAEHIANTLKRYREADQAVYQKTISEHGERVQHILKGRIA